MCICLCHNSKRRKCVPAARQTDLTCPPDEGWTTGRHSLPHRLAHDQLHLPLLLLHPIAALEPTAERRLLGRSPALARARTEALLAGCEADGYQDMHSRTSMPGMQRSAVLCGHRRVALLCMAALLPRLPVP
jgi:hypothetical protein